MRHLIGTGLRRHSIDVVEAMAGQRAGQLILVDVRDVKERARCHVPGSLHLPLGELKALMTELPSGRPIGFICQTGRRSAMAATAARRAGIDARNVTGGMIAWERKGLDLEKGPA